ncbi:RicAFT regulatory complex protein RicA family protein [Sutcliffiella cohnii]
MAKYTKQEIIAKARELATMISETEEVEFFTKAEEKINENQKVKEMIASVKSLQKQAVNFQHYGKESALEKTEAKLDNLLQEIDEIPIVQDFKESQKEVNDLLQLVASTITKTVTDEIIKTTGGDVLRGETGSFVRNSAGSSCN